MVERPDHAKISGRTHPRMEDPSLPWRSLPEEKEYIRKDGSLGLGLYIVRSIIAQHQGQVGVESLPGQGATFWFMLPLADEPIQDQAV